MLLAGLVACFAVTVVSSASKTVPNSVQLGHSASVGVRSVAGTPKSWVKHTCCLPRSTSTTCLLLCHQPQQHHDDFAKDELRPQPSIATARPQKCDVLRSFRTTSRAKGDDKTADDVELYFAYGANMSPAVLTGKRGVKPLASLPAEAVAFGAAEPNDDPGASVTGPFDRGTAAETGQGGICTCFCHRAGESVVTISI